MRTSAWLLLLALAACGREGASQRTESGQGVAQGAVVAARVNGEVISLAEVKRLSELSGLPPKQALARLVEERLLAQYAEARGYGELPTVGIELKRARVRSLLEEAVERGAAPADMSRDSVEKRFAELKPKLPSEGGEPQLSEHEQQVRKAMSNQERSNRLKLLLKELRDGTKVVYDEVAIQQALSDEGTAGTGT